MYHKPMTDVDGLAYSNINLAFPDMGASLVYLGYGQTKGYDNLGATTEDWSASILKAWRCLQKEPEVSCYY